MYWDSSPEQDVKYELQFKNFDKKYNKYNEDLKSKYTVDVNIEEDDWIEKDISYCDDASNASEANAEFDAEDLEGSDCDSN